MHPAYSVILFTTASGAGYGLLALLGLTAGRSAGLAGDLPSLLGVVLALLLITTGLLASTFHLGHPERAWRALSQWRSSWLSREGVLALATYPPALVFAWLWVSGANGALLLGLGLLTALLAMVTVVATGMIYASLATIRQWHHPLVVPVYLAFALAGGACLLLALASLEGEDGAFHYLLGLGALLVAGAAKIAYWRSIDRQPRDLDMAAATGLTGQGRVRQWEGAHTSTNFVQKEMGFQVARRHAAKLRRLVLLLLAAALLLVLITATVPGSAAALPAWLAVAAMLMGSMVERWLFFAEAQHVVSLFYGAQKA